MAYWNDMPDEKLIEYIDRHIEKRELENDKTGAQWLRWARISLIAGRYGELQRPALARLLETAQEFDAGGYHVSAIVAFETYRRLVELSPFRDLDDDEQAQPHTKSNGDA